MSKNKQALISSADADRICHALRSALSNFRESFDMLQEMDPDIVGAKTVFKSAEDRIIEALDILSGKK